MGRWTERWTDGRKGQQQTAFIINQYEHDNTQTYLTLLIFLLENTLGAFHNVACFFFHNSLCQMASRINFVTIFGDLYQN